MTDEELQKAYDLLRELRAQVSKWRRLKRNANEYGRYVERRKQIKCTVKKLNALTYPITKYKARIND